MLSRCNDPNAPLARFPFFSLVAVSLKQNGPPLSFLGFAAIYPLQTRRLFPTAYLPVGVPMEPLFMGKACFESREAPHVDKADHPASCPS